MVQNFYDSGGPTSGCYMGVFVDPKEAEAIEEEFAELVERADGGDGTEGEGVIIRTNCCCRSQPDVPIRPIVGGRLTTHPIPLCTGPHTMRQITTLSTRLRILVTAVLWLVSCSHSPTLAERIDGSWKLNGNWAVTLRDGMIVNDKSGIVFGNYWLVDDHTVRFSRPGGADLYPQDIVLDLVFVDANTMEWRFRESHSARFTFARSSPQ